MPLDVCGTTLTGLCTRLFLTSGTRKLPHLNTQRFSAAPEPWHDPLHPQTGLRGQTSGRCACLKMQPGQPNWIKPAASGWTTVSVTQMHQVKGAFNALGGADRLASNREWATWTCDYHSWSVKFYAVATLDFHTHIYEWETVLLFPLQLWPHTTTSWRSFQRCTRICQANRSSPTSTQWPTRCCPPHWDYLNFSGCFCACHPCSRLSRHMVPARIAVLTCALTWKWNLAPADWKASPDVNKP